MATRSGRKTVAGAGTAVQLSTSLQIAGPIAIKAFTTNTGIIYVGNVDGDVESTNGFSLAAGDVIIFNSVGDLLDIWIDSAVDGEGVSWLALSL